MDELDLLTHMYSETREYDHHYSNVRTTLSTFVVGLGIAAGGLLYRNEGQVLGEFPRYWLTLIIPLGFFILAYLLSAWFQRNTKACEMIQLKIESNIADNLMTKATPYPVWTNANKDENKKHLFFRSAQKQLIADKEVTVRGSWRNGPQIILAIVLLVHLGLWVVFVHCWSVLGFCTRNLSLQPITITQDGLVDHLNPPLQFRWKPVEGINLYKLTVKDETGAELCASNLQKETVYICQEFRKEGKVVAAKLGTVKAAVETFALGRTGPKLDFSIPVGATGPDSRSPASAGSTKRQPRGEEPGH